MQLDAAMGSTMTERFNVAGAMLAKLFGRPPHEAGLFAQQAGKVRDIGVAQAMYGSTLFIVLTLLASLSTAVIYGWVAPSSSTAPSRSARWSTLAMLLNRLYGPITSLSNVQVHAMTALVSFDRVFEVLDLKPLIEDRPDAVPLALTAESNGSARTSGPRRTLSSTMSRSATPPRPRSRSRRWSPSPCPRLSSTDATHRVLHDVSFTAPARQLTALVGPSGAGKTTITHLVSRLYDPDEGAVRIAGSNLRDVTQQSLHDTVGVVTQDAHLFHDTIRANLSMPVPGRPTRNSSRPAGRRRSGT